MLYVVYNNLLPLGTCKTSNLLDDIRFLVCTLMTSQFTKMCFDTWEIIMIYKEETGYEVSS